MITKINSVKMVSPSNYHSFSKAQADNLYENNSGMIMQQTPLGAFKGYALANSVAFKGKMSVVTKALSNYVQEFKMPADNKTAYKTFNDVIGSYAKAMKNTIAEFNIRRVKKGQFLKWVDLPSNQLKINRKTGMSHLDEIVNQANILKGRRNPDGTERPLVVLGIGGSKHTVEFLANMTGVGNKGKLYSYSDIDPVSFRNFVKETGKDIKGLNFLVVSKSGTTFETADGFKRFENELIKAYKKDGMNIKNAKAAAQKHFAICTDANATATNMRGQIGSKNGELNNYIKELYVHDDVGGRYSMFDDQGLFALSYAGVPKNTIQRILKGAQNASKVAISDDISKNAPAKSAIFTVFSRDNGYEKINQQYFGKLFEGGGENWRKQLYLESLKDFDLMVGTAPALEHYATEGLFTPANRHMYNTVMTMLDPKMSKNYDTYTKVLAETYNETTPLSLETLKIAKNTVKPESIGEYVQSKHFETVFDGMLRRSVKNQKLDMNKAIPEVLQPSVETYKNKFKMGKYKLNPGK